MIHDNSHADPKIEDFFLGKRNKARRGPAIFQNSGGHEENLGAQILAKETMKTPGRNRLGFYGQTSNGRMESTQSANIHDGRRR